MTTLQVFETSVTVNNIPLHDYSQPEGHIQPAHEMTPEFKPLVVLSRKIWQGKNAISFHLQYQAKLVKKTLPKQI